MFWGLIMEPERRYTQEVKKSFHISMAALDFSSSGDETSQLMCGYEGRNYLLCTLRRPDMLQCALDLEFAAGTEVSFASNGKAHIHLTGYLTDVDEDDENGLNLEDLAEQEEEVDEEQAVDTVNRGKKKSNKNLRNLERTKEVSKKVIQKRAPTKRAKLLNGSAKEDETGLEEESDDPDYEEGDEEIESEEGDDDEVEEEEGEDGEDNEADDNQEEEAEDEEQEVQQKLSKKEKKKLKQEAADGQKKSKKTEQPQKKQKRTLTGGVVVEDLIEGDGPPAKLGRFINVYYEGRLEKNNKMFDRATKGPGFKFRLGVGEVIKAWDIGLVGMKVGGVRKIICPPHTAYGSKGSPPAIPPNSTLVFTVTLKKIN